MNRLLAAVLTSLALTVGLMTAPADTPVAPQTAEACTAGVGGDIFHHTTSVRTHLQITNNWGTFTVYYLPRGYWDDAIIPGNDCGSENDADGYYVPRGYASQHYNSMIGSWVVYDASYGWTKVSDTFRSAVRLISCGSTSAC